MGKIGSSLLEPQVPIYTVAVNPSVCQGKDGRYYLIIKGDNNPSPKRHLIQAIGTSDNPTGPFVLERKPAFQIFQQRMFVSGLIRREEDFMHFFMLMEETLLV